MGSAALVTLQPQTITHRQIGPDGPSACKILDHFTEYASSHGVRILRLETGIHQHAAIALYERVGFKRIPPFGEYRDDPVSRCYEKRIQ